MTYWEHFRINMRVASKGLLLCLFHATHAIFPVEWTSHHYWGVHLGKGE
jgi:hypothetical protein